MLQRRLHAELIQGLRDFPAVGVLGPRQVGKTTLARSIGALLDRPVTYLDLERESDRRKLVDAEGLFESLAGSVVILDEIQRAPELFPLLRSLIDDRIHGGARTGHFVLLGSASRDVLARSSETLAGRILYLDLAPFTLGEFAPTECTREFIERLWVRGGYPGSLLAANDDISWKWREAFVDTYLERDIPMLGPRLPAERLRRFWSMLAHGQGEAWNGAKLAAGLEVSGHTVKHYLDVLSDLGMVRLLRPWSGNSRKRLVRSPKVYVRDSGLLHRLAHIPDLDTLLGHPLCGLSFEGFAIEQLLTFLPRDFEVSYFRTATQHEIDLVLEGPRSQVIAIEIKRSRSPSLSAGFKIGCDEIRATERYVVIPDGESFSLGSETRAIALREMIELIVGETPKPPKRSG